MLPRTAVLAFAWLGLVGCGSPTPNETGETSSDGETAATTNDGTQDSSSDATSDTTGDTGPEPLCPFVVGEVLSCECGPAEGCSGWSDEAVGCVLGCILEEPCPRIECEFDDAYDNDGCSHVVNPEAVDCVLAQLATGLPFQWSLQTSDTYINSWGGTLHVTQRLGDTAFARHSATETGNDAFGQEDYASFRLGEVSAESWQSCAAPSETNPAECLRRLSITGTCEAFEALACPG